MGSDQDALKGWASFLLGERFGGGLPRCGSKWVTIARIFVG